MPSFSKQAILATCIALVAQASATDTCQDQFINCADFGPDSGHDDCWNPSSVFYQKCPSTCRRCPGAEPLGPRPCVDKIVNCEEAWKQHCYMDTPLGARARDLCMATCNVPCGEDGGPTTEFVAPDKIPDDYCQDSFDAATCNAYDPVTSGRDNCWNTESQIYNGCARTCRRCTSSVPLGPKPCVDIYSNCASLKPFCSIQSIQGDNLRSGCKKTCEQCDGASTVVTEAPTDSTGSPTASPTTTAPTSLSESPTASPTTNSPTVSPTTTSPTTSPTARQTADTCQDKFINCGDFGPFSGHDDCWDESSTFYQNCPKTCRRCADSEPLPTRPCVDKFSNCPTYWKKHCFLDTSSGDRARRNCMATCGTECDASGNPLLGSFTAPETIPDDFCEDVMDSCDTVNPLHGDRDECWDPSSSFYKYCPRTCGRCASSPSIGPKPCLDTFSNCPQLKDHCTAQTSFGERIRANCKKTCEQPCDGADGRILF